MLYRDLKFPFEAKIPYFYTNFVATIDGKIQVLEDTEAYWPLGSKLDYETLIELRTYADVLIHGSTTALAHPTLISLSKEGFHKARKRTKKTEILYIVVSNHPTDDLVPKLASTHEFVRTMVITSEKVRVSTKLTEATEVVRLGRNEVNLRLLSDFLQKRGKKHILVEGGPTLMGSFFKANLINEIFLTIAPKAVGNMPGKTLTMIEGFLYPPADVPRFELISCQPVGNEVYLRYKITKR